jgi:hypothetical protein
MKHNICLYNENTYSSSNITKYLFRFAEVMHPWIFLLVTTCRCYSDSNAGKTTSQEYIIQSKLQKRAR